MSENVLLTIVMPTYNVERYISSALASLLNQSVSNWRCYVIDDCSTDNTLTVIESMVGDDKRFEIVRLHRNTGHPSIVRNIALRQCKTKYIAFLDGDDYWHRDKIKKQLKIMEQNEIAASYTGVAIVGSLSNIQKTHKPRSRCGNIFGDLIKRNDITTSSVMINVNYLKILEEPYFDETLKIGEDYDLYLRLAMNFKFGCLGDILVYWRNHALSLTKIPAKQIEVDLEKVLVKLMSYCENYKDYKLEIDAFRLRINYYRAKHYLDNKDIVSARDVLYKSRFASFQIMVLWLSLFFGTHIWDLIHYIKNR